MINMKTNAMKEMSQRIYVFDLLKFIGAIGIATLHFNWKLIPQGYLFVEMFFIISAFLLYLNVEQYKQQNYISILIKRIDSFYLFYILAIIAQISLNGAPSLANFLSSLLFLGDIGLGQRYTYGALWLLGVYVFCFMFYIGIFFSLETKKAFLAVGIIVFLSLFSIYTYSPAHALNRTYEITVGPFQFGLLRGIIGIGWGILLATIGKKSILSSTKISWLGLISIILILIYIFHQATPMYDIINYFTQSLLILMCYMHKEKLNQYINGKISFIFSLSLPVYIFHPFVIDVLKKEDVDLSTFNWFIYIGLVLFMAISMRFFALYIVKFYHKTICYFVGKE